MQQSNQVGQHAVKIFKGSVNDMERQINTWVSKSKVKIINTSMTYDTASNYGLVFVIVTFEITSQTTSLAA